MKTRKIGSLDVSIVGLGCNNFGWRQNQAETERVVHAALEAGINFFDTADMYGDTLSETYLSQAFKGHRDEAVIATKFGWALDDKRGGAHPDYVRQAVDDSLKRLKVDHIDLYQLHKPDPKVPIADTLAALDELVKAGKVREIGCSNFSAEQLKEAEAYSQSTNSSRFVSVQNEFSLLQREPEQAVLPVTKELNLAFLPYFPLASGLLSGKYRLNQPLPENSRLSGSAPDQRKLELVEKLLNFAQSQGHRLLELAFAWLLAHDTVASVIAGATRVEQVQANAKAAQWQLSEAELAECAKILKDF